VQRQGPEQGEERHCGPGLLMEEGTWTGCLLAMETREGEVAVAVPKGAADPLNCNKIILLNCNLILLLDQSRGIRRVLVSHYGVC
jgi:hypothetical protein